MPKNQEEAYLNNDSFSFEGSPEDIDVEKELNDAAGSIAYDPYKLAKVLMGIGEQMLGVSLYSYQYEPAFRIIYSMLVRDGAEITMLLSRQGGKSEVVTFCVNVIGVMFPVLAKIFPKELGHFKNGVKMGLLAPQGEQVSTVYDRCMERLLSEPVRRFLRDPDVNDEPLSTVNFRLKNGSFLKGQSAAKQSKIESKTYHIVFLDESQDIDAEKVRKSIIPMTASTFGTIVRTGTPNRKKGDFYFTIQRNKTNDGKLKSAKERECKKNHFEYDYKEVIKSKKQQYIKDKKDFHLLYEKAVNRDIQSMGMNSDEFRMSYKIEWLLEVGMFITERALEEQTFNKRIGFPDTTGMDDFAVGGLDIASARNSTVLTTGLLNDVAYELGDRPVKTVAGWCELSNTNYDIQLDILISEIIARKIRVLYADSTGVGRALTDMLIYHVGEIVEIVPYVFTAASKSDMWKRLDEDIANERIIVPAHKSVKDTKEFSKFVEQMTNLQKTWKGSFMICDKTPGYMDDYCDSLGLMNLAGNHLYNPPTSIEVSQNILVNTSSRASLAKQSKW